MPFIRTFIGVQLQAPARKRARKLIARLQQSDANARWVDDEEMHITLSFLGDTVDTLVPKVCKAVDEVAKEASPFNLSLKGAGAFPDIARPRVAWLGVEDGADHLTALHRSLETAIRALGVQTDGRKYTPHMTLGRIRGRSQPLTELLKQQAEVEAGESMVSELVVFSSSMEKSGPVYAIMHRAPLLG